VASVVALDRAEAAADEPSAGPAAATDETIEDYRVGLFDCLFTNMLGSVSGYNLVLHGLAIGSTAALSPTGADDSIQRWFWRDNAILGDGVTEAVFVSGWFTPLIIPGSIALAGLAVDDGEAASAGVTALQAVGINALITQLAKWVTGRPLPYDNGLPSEDDGPFSIERSDDGRAWGFVFGGGVAWPSGHTSSHMALASSLVAFYSDEHWLPFVAYPLVALTGAAMLEGDHHWASDIVAGALIGHAVGWTVGSNMRRSYDGARGLRIDEPSALRIQPAASADGFMLALAYEAD